MRFYEFSNLHIKANSHPKCMISCAFESPWPIFCIFALCEHLRALHVHLWAFLIHAFQKCFEKCDFFIKMYFTSMLVDARKMLVDAHKVQKCKVWIKGFPTHNFACILDKNSSKYVEFNLRALFAFLQNWKFLAEKMQKWWNFIGFQIYIFKRNYIEITW